MTTQKSAKSEDDARDINARLETYRKSIRANVSSSSDNSEGSDTKIETNNHAPGEKSVEESIEEVREYLECAICCENFADLGSVQQSHLSSQFAFQYRNLPQLLNTQKNVTFHLNLPINIQL